MTIKKKTIAIHKAKLFCSIHGQMQPVNTLLPCVKTKPQFSVSATFIILETTAKFMEFMSPGDGLCETCLALQDIHWRVIQFLCLAKIFSLYISTTTQSADSSISQTRQGKRKKWTFTSFNWLATITSNLRYFGPVSISCP